MEPQTCDNINYTASSLPILAMLILLQLCYKYILILQNKSDIILFLVCIQTHKAESLLSMLMEEIISITNSKQQTVAAVVVLSWSCRQYFRFNLALSPHDTSFVEKFVLSLHTYGIILHITWAAERVKHFSALRLLIETHFYLLRQTNLVRQYVIINFKPLLIALSAFSQQSEYNTATNSVAKISLSKPNDNLVPWAVLGIFRTKSHAC